jgi:SAM-dependent methyltransferase
MRTPIKDYVEYAKTKYSLQEPVIDLCAGWEPNFYQPLFDGYQYLKQDQVQFDPPTIDYVCDVHRLEPIQDESVNTVLLLEALEHIREPQKVIEQVRRILKPGGFCVATTLMCFEIHRCPYDYWRYCPDGINFLFKDFLLHEITLEHSLVLPRGIWCVAQKPTADMKGLRPDPLIRVVESGTNPVKNFIKKAFLRMGYDLVAVPRKTDGVQVVGRNETDVWISDLK